MTANIVCFISAKGGSGKTVTSSAIGTFLSSLGFRVLLVDTDAATNGMTLLYLEQLLGRRRQRNVNDAPGWGLFEVVPNAIPVPLEITEKLHLVPATFGMKDTENTDLSQFGAALRSISEMGETYDFIFLDAQAGTDNFARATADISDQCVIVSEYDPVSAQGIERLKVLFANVISPSSTWILFNKVLPEFASAIGEGLAVARYLAPVPWDADVVRAFARRDLAINMRAPNAYTLAVAQVVYNLFPDETGDAIERWRGEALEAVTAPIEDRLRELLGAENDLESRARRRRRISQLLGLGAFCGVILFTIYLQYLFTVLFGVDNSVELGRLSDRIRGIIVNYGSLILLGGIFISGLLINFIRTNNSVAASRVDMTFRLIRDEQEKLRTTLDAAHSALKSTQDAGYYERRRREPSPPA